LTLPTHSCDATCQANDQNATGINPSSAWNSAANKLTVSAGNTVILSSGTYYFKDITVDGTLNVDTTTGPVNIFYTNSFTEKNGGCSVNNLSLIPSRLLIADTAGSHTVTLQCGAPLYAYMEGSTNHFNLQSGQFIYGHFSGGTTVIASGAGLHFDLSGGVPATHVDWTTGSAGAWAESYKRQ
jgi:hypothetical protein